MNVQPPPLSPKIEGMITRICTAKHVDPPDATVRLRLSKVDERVAFDVVRKIFNRSSPIKTLSGLINYFLNQLNTNTTTGNGNGNGNGNGGSGSCCGSTSPPQQVTTSSIVGSGSGGTTTPSPSESSRKRPWSSSSHSVSPPTSSSTHRQFLIGENSGHRELEIQLGCPSISDLQSERPNKISRQLQYDSEVEDINIIRQLQYEYDSEVEGSVKQPLPPEVYSEPECSETKAPPPPPPPPPVVFSYQRTRLSQQLEFRKLFLIYTYIGRKKFEDAVSDEDADKILDEMKHLPMNEFESRMWKGYGVRNVDPKDRLQSTQWDSGKTHVYYCNAYEDGSFCFKGPYLNNTSTHLQRSLGDDNVLIVKFVGGDRCFIKRIFKDGIFIGLRHYKFFVFKDEGRKKEREMENDNTPSVRCYFVNYDSIPDRGNSCPSNLNKGRCQFMHVHMASSLVKYMSRFSLILSKTIKLPVDLSGVVITTIDDIPCRDEKGKEIRVDGEVQILTDGTGFISEDLALKCPQNFQSAKFDRGFEEDQQGRAKNWNKDPPLLMQCRLFSKGLAVKGTLLVNRKIGTGKIQVRSSMVKVQRDMSCPDSAFDSLEIVAVSHKPKRCQLSKNLIALLNYGGVPREFFLDILQDALEETQTSFTNFNAALRVSLRNVDIDDGGTAARMLLAGVPLSEPFLQDRLATFVNYERKSLKEGRLPIGETFYLIGTADPTGRLKPNQVCVIMESGQISGKVLVYRNPGLHFGDIHVMEAVYVKEIEEMVGNAKFGIFFSTKGQRSVGTEIANGDFDGDTYWVSRNPQLLSSFSASTPWSRVYSSPPAENKNPKDFSAEELEDELFQLFLEKQNPCFNMAVAADSWLAFMDSLLMHRDSLLMRQDFLWAQGDEDASEPHGLRQKLLKLVDIYYDALDAPKSGKKVTVPFDLRAKEFPHYMGKKCNSYQSTSILGEIFDKAGEYQFENRSVGGISKLPCFDLDVPKDCMNLWSSRYEYYRLEMQEALSNKYDSPAAKNAAANAVTKKYKELLYDATELEESRKDMERINDEALAIYHVCYDFAICRGTRQCTFAWKVAGAALCRIYAARCSTNEYPMIVAASVLRDHLL